MPDTSKKSCIIHFNQGDCCIKMIGKFLEVFLLTQKLKIMVKITGYKEFIREDGTTYFMLELQGGVEMVLGKNGQHYATAKKALLSSTFDEEICKNLIGTELQGEIVKVEVEPYDYISKTTGEVMTLSNRWIFKPSESEN